MRLKAIIVDHENNNIDLLRNFLEIYVSDSIEVIAVSNNAREGELLIDKLNPSVLFLDVKTVLFLDTKLKLGTSFDLLLKIKPYEYMVIFVAPFHHSINQTLKYSAVYYIIKPVKPNEVISSISLIWKQYHQLKVSDFTNQIQLKTANKEKEPTNEFVEILGIPQVGSTLFVKYKNILYCKSDGKYTEIHLKDGHVEVSSKNLGKYEQLLPSFLFFRIHKSFLVNINMITKILKDNGIYCELSTGITLPISTRKYAELYKLLNIV